jgi:hypothetical protein
MSAASYSSTHFHQGEIFMVTETQNLDIHLAFLSPAGPVATPIFDLTPTLRNEYNISEARIAAPRAPRLDEDEEEEEDDEEDEDDDLEDEEGEYEDEDEDEDIDDEEDEDEYEDDDDEEDEDDDEEEEEDEDPDELKV